MLPRASFNVVTAPADSSRTLFNIVAAASELVKRGNVGRGLPNVWEKNKGEVGPPWIGEKALGTVSGSSI